MNGESDFPFNGNIVGKSMRFNYKAAALVTALTTVAGSGAIAGELSGNVSAQGRIFAQPAIYETQDRHNLSTAIDLEYYHDLQETNGRLVFSGFARWDANDSRRTHGDVRELYYWHGFDDFELYAGCLLYTSPSPRDA